MKFEEFLTKYNKQVFSIGYDKQLILAIEVCKKLYFDYVEFSKKYQRDDKDILLDAIAILEQSILTSITQNIIEQTLSKVESITPDMDDFGSDELGSYALNACSAVYHSIQFISDKQPKHIYDIGICLTDTIDLKIQEQQILTEQEIENNHLMIATWEYLIDKSK